MSVSSPLVGLFYESARHNLSLVEATHAAIQRLMLLLTGTPLSPMMEVELVFVDAAEVGVLGKLLAWEPVGVLVGATLPGACGSQN